MRSYSEHPESEENQRGTRENERAVFAAQMEARAAEECQVCRGDGWLSSEDYDTCEACQGTGKKRAK